METYANLPTNTLNTGESPYESPFLLSGGEASGYEMPSPLNTLSESAAPEVSIYHRKKLCTIYLFYLVSTITSKKMS